MASECCYAGSALSHELRRHITQAHNTCIAVVEPRYCCIALPRIKLHQALTGHVSSCQACSPPFAVRAEIVHINEVIGGAETGAYLLTYDSIHGTYDRKVEAAADDSGFSVDGHFISYSGEKTIEGVDWKALNIDVVCDCTGVFLTKAKLQPYFDAGVQRVVVSAPVKEAGVLNVVVGVRPCVLHLHLTLLMTFYVRVTWAPAFIHERRCVGAFAEDAGGRNAVLVLSIWMHVAHVSLM